MKMETFLNSQKRRKVKFDPVDVNPEERDPFCELILFFFFHGNRQQNVYTLDLLSIFTQFKLSRNRFKKNPHAIHKKYFYVFNKYALVKNLLFLKYTYPQHMGSSLTHKQASPNNTLHKNVQNNRWSLINPKIISLLVHNFVKIIFLFLFRLV